MKEHLYYETLDWGSYWKNFFQQNRDGLLKALRENLGTKNIFLTRSGRTAILLSLKAFGLTREDEVMVPRFMNTCVLDAVNQIASPSLYLTEHTKAILLYHQWGYQQDYVKAQRFLGSRKLWIIEDCAHGIWGSSQGKVTGAFGHTAMFSLSKTFKMTYAGALQVNDPALVSKIEEMLSSKPSFKDIYESLRGEWEYLRFYNAPSARHSCLDVQIGVAKWYATLLKYANLTTVRGNVPRSKEDMKHAFDRQHKHFLLLRKNARNTSFMLDGDDDASMAPVCFPVFSEDIDFLKRVDQWLKDKGICTGIYHFDLNRCMFEPHYKKCVPVPLYASLPDEFYGSFDREFKGKY